MSYLQKSLMPGEEIIGNAKLHWIVFWKPVFLIAISIYGIRNSEGIFFILLFYVGIAHLLATFLTYKTSEFAVTTRRVFIKVGIVRRSSVELLLQQMEGLYADQGIVGRVLGFGSLVVTGSGGSKTPFHRVSDPLGFRQMVLEQQMKASET